jgi:histidinol-phosphate/aromatic aminotransferase/cobyric acid decarboxylase-like protein
VSSPVAPPPGAHGGDGPRLARRLGVPVDQILDLSANLNPCAPDVADLVAARASAVRRYPDPTAAAAALADAIGVDADRVVLTNGGAEAIALVAAECPVGAVDEPDFSLYARHLAQLHPAGPRWRSNPHVPTGRLAAPDESAAVWDEAFYPLATGTWTRGDPGAIVVGSLTKVFACPGLRIGYVIARDQAFADRLRERQPAWSVNALACELLPPLLALAELAAWRDETAALRERLVGVLRGAGLEPQPSDASWVLVPRARSVREHLAPRGVLVRDTTSFGQPDGVRIAVPDADGVERLAGALDGWRP